MTPRKVKWLTEDGEVATSDVYPENRSMDMTEPTKSFLPFWKNRFKELLNTDKEAKTIAISESVSSNNPTFKNLVETFNEYCKNHCNEMIDKTEIWLDLAVAINVLTRNQADEVNGSFD